MFHKKIVCFANSQKWKNRCVAGKDLNSFEWVRPVSDNGEIKGALTDQDIAYSDGSIPKVLDIIYIPFKEQSSTIYQPENILIENQRWEKVNVLDVSKLRSFCDHPETLWLNDQLLDRVPLSKIAEGAIGQSLFLIEPQEIRISNNYGKIRAIFKYNDVEYNLGITDFDIREKYRNKDTGDYSVEASNILLCVSLGEPFKGYTDSEECCYKLVASVICFDDI